MKHKQILEYETFPLTELSAEDAELTRAAKRALEKSYSPYSGYRVGASARLESGRIITATNQESAVFPAGLCAERILLYAHMASEPDDRIVAMAVIASDPQHECRPCGECRQVMVDVEERQGRPYRIIMCCDNSATIVDSPTVLLPFPFEM